MTEISYSSADKTAQETPELECKAEELSTNFYWTFGKHEIFNIQTTIRGNPSLDEINAHIAAAIDGMKLAVDAGGHAKPVGQQPNRAAPARSDDDVAAQAAQEVGKGNGAPALPPPAPAAPASQPAGGTMDAHCILIEIGTSYTGGKTQLKFLCDAMEHPLTYTRSPGDMVKLLAPLGYTAAHIVVGQRYQADCTVTYGETSKDGKIYKNVLSVRPAT